jgi:hypothetical protein
VSGQIYALAAIPPGKSPRYPLDRRFRGLQNRTERREENSWPYRDSNSDLTVGQPVASLYTDYAIPVPVLIVALLYKAPWKWCNQKFIIWNTLFIPHFKQFIVAVKLILLENRSS